MNYFNSNVTVTVYDSVVNYQTTEHSAWGSWAAANARREAKMTNWMFILSFVASQSLAE